MVRAIGASLDSWQAAYANVLDGLQAVASTARPTLCGLSVCVDAMVSLHDAGALFDAAHPPEAVRFAAALLQRAAAGVGGEVRVDWPDGPGWLDEQLPFKLDLGGTAAHAARALATLGAPALLALETRSPEQLALLHPEIWLAHAGRAVPAESIQPDHRNAPKIYIFEYTKDRAIGEVVPPRSSRIIVRFTDPGLENDAEFWELSSRLAPHAGAALLAGFNTIGAGDLATALANTRKLARSWCDAKLPMIHLELGGYDRPQYRDRVLVELSDYVTSLGLSLSELGALVRDHNLLGDDVAGNMCALGATYGLRRVCVHADEWSATATLDDPQRERDALLVGNLLASSRAAHGRPIRPRSLPADAVFATPPLSTRSLGPWNIVVCAAPYLAHPSATVGLGDTFTAGCLLMLGRHHSQSQLTKPLYRRNEGRIDL